MVYSHAHRLCAVPDHRTAFEFLVKSATSAGFFCRQFGFENIEYFFSAFNIGFKVVQIGA